MTAENAFPTRTYITGLIAVILMAIMAMLWAYRDRLYVYQDHFLGNGQRSAMNWHELRADMGEKEVLAHFGTTALRCRSDRDATQGVGERVCYAKLNLADDLPALSLGVFFKSNRLSMVVLHVPWWAHAQWVRRMQESFGVSVRYSGQARGLTFGNLGQAIQNYSKGEPVYSPILHWALAHGALDMNRDRFLVPMEWSVIMWTPAKIKP
jgi:hypothetical protein